MDELKELPPFLSHDNPQVRQQVCKIIAGFSTSRPHQDFFCTMDPPVLPRLISVLSDDDADTAKTATQAMVNLADHTGLRNKMIDLGAIGVVINCLKKRTNPLAELHCMLLQNLTIDVKGAKKCAQDGTALEGLNTRLVLQWATDPDRLVTGDPYKYLVNVITNLTQTGSVRTLVADPERNILATLKEQLKSKCPVRRMGVLLMIQNLLRDVELHEFMISEDLGLMADCLLMIVGPEELDDDDTENYLAEILIELGPEKRRETDPKIRRGVFNVLNLCLYHKPSRKYLKSIDTYTIVRECHKFEQAQGLKIYSESEMEELNDFIEERLVNMLCRAEDDDPPPPEPEKKERERKPRDPEEEKGNDPNMIPFDHPGLVRF